ncbi:hypothetical protein SmJEL517_g03996 [Synchytrium microbalum]|uniref:GTP:AMP phosphotransferase, mitochondrial n=1 Tax=Synchytrium microbalum TaxID=1806994 RepID=A0A507C5Z2_9FUNG|nr:uncharacterized protein SmJEL517_g03996 [Synchytrium microbalum]TPX32963.1 hypothetical protein SmJEL517_g03996 [Synchytrium microbalum]
MQCISWSKVASLRPIQQLNRICTQLEASRQAHTRRGAGSLRFLIMGCPGSGKGTQTSRIIKQFPVTTTSAGDLLRDHITRGTDVGKVAAKYIDQGNLVPDELIINLVLEELNASLLGKNWILDGFPRTLGQAKSLDAKLNEMKQPLDLVINLDVPEEVILGRIMDRWIHAPSGRVYNLSYNPPKVAGKDDITGEPLSKRADDNVETFKTRLDKYHSATRPLLEYYKTQGILKSFSGKTSDEIFPKIQSELKTWF